MITRRTFMKSIAGATGAASLSSSINALPARRQTGTSYFDVHAFIKANPNAVFIMYTDAAAEAGAAVGTSDKDIDEISSPAKKYSAGLAFGQSVFVPSDETGYPLNTSIPVKPNLKVASKDPSKYVMKYVTAHPTDPYFMEGMVEGVKGLGVAGNQFHLRETNNYGFWPYYGYLDNTTAGTTGMVSRTGVDLRTASTTLSGLTSGVDYNWVEVPNGIFYNKIPYLAPINTANTFMLNVAKMKSHGMGLTLCCKNLQGSAAQPYQRFCNDYGSTWVSTNINANAYTTINTNFLAHYDTIPRWTRGGTSGTNYNTGRGMETWATRTLDNVSATPCALHIIEGIVAREGQGDSDYGPVWTDSGTAATFTSTGTSTAGKAANHLSNIIIFGKNVFNVDIIGDYIGGHEPGNFGLFHCAKDRGLLTTFNPWNVPIYIWDSATGTATQVSLSSLTRWPLKTYYLPKSTETGANVYHLVNEEYNYGDTGVATEEAPRSFLLNQNYPNPFNPNTSIQYVVPKGGGQVRLEVYNISGQLIEVIAEGRREAGAHMAVWNAYNRASGTYFYRYRCNGFSETRKMLLLK